MSTSPRSTWRGPRRAARAPRTISRGLVARSCSASRSRSRLVGSGRGAHFGGRTGGWSGCSSRSKRTVVMSTPEMPSTSAWWLLPTTAKRSPSSPSTSHSSQSGLRAVELLGEDPRRKVAQLLLGARRRQRRAPHVVVEVEEGVVDPDRPALVEGDGAQLLAEAGDEVQARLDLVAELLVGGRLAVEDDHRGDVHVGAGALHVEERGIEPGQSIRIHRIIFAEREGGPSRQGFHLTFSDVAVTAVRGSRPRKSTRRSTPTGMVLKP